MRNIQTVKQLQDLQTETYVYAAIVVLGIFVVAWLLANAVPYRGGTDRSYIKRRVCLIATIVVGALAFWLYNDLYVMDYVQKTAFKSQFAHTNHICLGITMAGSALLSVLVMLCWRHSKFGSILGGQKKA